MFIMHNKTYKTPNCSFNKLHGSNTNVFCVGGMVLEDCCRFFADLGICCLCPGWKLFLSLENLLQVGRWVAGLTANLGA